MAKFRAIVINAKDNVATAVEAIASSADVAINIEGETVSVHVTEAIPFGHKFAIKDIRQEAAIVKYGQVIGLATKNIKVGQYVHIHNLESCRGRGDKETLQS